MDDWIDQVADRVTQRIAQHISETEVTAEVSEPPSSQPEAAMSEVTVHVDQAGNISVPFNAEALGEQVATSIGQKATVNIKPFAGGMETTVQAYGKDDSSKFMAEYEQSAKIMKWDKATKALRFPMYLHEPARTWHRRATFSCLELWEQWDLLKRKFEEKFVPKGKQQTALELAQNRKQQAMESVLAYHMSMEELLEDAKITDDISQMVFVRKGLLPEIQTILKANLFEPTSLEELIEGAEKAERSLKQEPKDILPPSVSNAVMTVEQAHSPDNQTQVIIDKLNEMALNIERQPRDRSRSGRQFGQRNDRSYDRDRSRDRSRGRSYDRNRQVRFNDSRGNQRNFRNDRSQDRGRSSDRRQSGYNSPRNGNNYRTPSECWYCHKTGHIQVNCFKRQREEGNQTPNTQNRNNWKNRNVATVVNNTSTSDSESDTDFSVCSVNEVLTATSNKQTQMILEVIIDGLKATAIVDTGAGPSLVTYNFFKKTGLKLNEYHGSVTVADNSSMDVIGYVRLDVNVRLGVKEKIIPHKFLVVRDLPFDLILGRKFNSRANFQIDCATETVTFAPGQKAKVKTKVEEQQPPVNQIHSKEEVLIPGRHKMILALKTSEGTTRKVLYVHSNPDGYTRENRQPILSNAVVKVKNGEFLCEVLNLSPEPYLVKAGHVLGNFEGVNGNDLVDCPEVDEIVEEEKNGCQVVCSVAPGFDTTTLSKPEHSLTEMKLNGGSVQVGSQLSELEQYKLRQLLLKNEDVFAFNKHKMGSISAKKFTHRIDTGDHEPIAQSPARHSPFKNEVIRRQIEEMIDLGVIRPSISPWACRAVIVPKKNGELRFACDYRALNAITKKMKWPLPNIQDALDALRGSTLFTSLDLKKAYWQVPIHEKDKEKTAFITADGLYEWNVMPFGLTNAVAIFQKAMDVIFSGLKWNQVLTYLDDILVFAPDFPTMCKRLNAVFSRIREVNLVVHPAKCFFCATQLKFLGFVVDADGQHPNPDNVKAIMDMEVHPNVTSIRRFLAMVSFYRKFIPGCATIGAPLNELTRNAEPGKGKRQPVKWTKECSKAVAELKQAMVSSSCLVHFDPTRETQIRTDASGLGVGAILLQKHGNKFRPVHFASRVLRKKDGEDKYGITELECLAVVFAVDRFRHYIDGMQFEVISDHCALCFLRKKEKLTRRLHGWILLLAEQDFVIKHRKGKAMGDVDCLSRAPLQDPAPEDTDRMFACVSIETVDLFREGQSQDPAINPIKLALLANKDYYPFQLVNGLVYRVINGHKRLYVPSNLREQVLYDFHDNTATGGHFGRDKTLSGLISHIYYWPKMSEYVKNYIKTCVPCQRKNIPKVKPAGLMSPIEVSYPWKMVGIDLVGPLVESDGMKWIIVCTDYFTKMVEADSLPDGTADSCARFWVRQIFCRHGAVEIVVSDQGRQFLSNMFETVLKLLGTKHLKTSSYHPQTNGLCERVNGILVNSIAKFVQNDQQKWASTLPLVVFAYNCSKHSSTGFTPHYLNYKENPVFPTDLNLDHVPTQFKDKQEYLSAVMEAWPRVRRQVVASINKASENQARNYDSKRKHVVFKEGDSVLVYTPIRKVGFSEKLISRYLGPYVIVKRASDVSYLIREPRSGKQEFVHVSRMKMYWDRNTILEVERYMPMGPVSSNHLPEFREHSPSSLQPNEPPPLPLDVRMDLAEDERDPREHEATPDPNEVIASNPTPARRRIQPDPNFVTKLLSNMTTLLMLFSLVDISSAVFNTVPPIVWKRIDKHVVTGSTIVYYELHYESPCTIYERFGSMTPAERKQFVNWCDDLYLDSFIAPLQDFCRHPSVSKSKDNKYHLSRPKRELVTFAVLGLVTVLGLGVVGLTIYNTVKESSLSSQMDAVNLRADALSSKQEIINKQLKTIEDTLSEAVEKFNNFTTDYQTFRSELPAMIMSTADLSSRLTSTHDRLQILGRDWSSGFVHPVFSSLFNFTIPCNGTCPASLRKPIDCELDIEDDVLKFAFEVTEVDSRSHILQAQPFRLYTINDTHACTVAYTGPKFVLYHDKLQSSCPLTIRSFDEHDILLPSGRKNCSRNTTASLWSSNSCHKRSSLATEDLVQVKKVGHLNYILCLGFNITVFGQSLTCPEKVFTLPSNVSFKINDLQYSSDFVRVNSQVDFVPFWQHHVNTYIAQDVNPYHISGEHHFDHIPNDGIRLATKHLGWSVLLLLTVIGIMLCLAVHHFFHHTSPLPPQDSNPEEGIEMDVFSPRPQRHSNPEHGINVRVIRDRDLVDE